MPLERDEGEYAYIAQQMLRGVWPYESAYSMKLPGIYVMYGMILAVFGQTQTSVHVGLIIINAATILLIFLLARRFFGGLAGVASAGAYAIMSLSTSVLGLSANAEHFVILPALVGILLIAKPAERMRWLIIFTAGLLFGFAFIVKQHGMFFALFGSLYLLYLDVGRRPVFWKRTIITQVIFAVGAAAPFVLTCFLFWQAGLFDKFWFWTFTYAHKYATSIPLSVAWHLLKRQFLPVVESAKLIWFFVAAGVFCVIMVRQYRQWAVLTLGLLIFSFLAVCPGFYFRGHYFIFLLPAAAILSGVGFASLGDRLFGRFKIFHKVILMSLIGLGIGGYSLYEQRTYLFDNTPEEVCRLIYGANPFAESIPIAEYIREHTDPDDTIGVVGSEPQIYFYAGRRAATRYIYMYPLMELHGDALQMQEEMISEIESAQPEYLVLVRVSTSWLTHPGSVDRIFKWFDSYYKEYYTVVGIADIFVSGQVVWFWDEQAVNHKPSSGFWVAVLKRRP